MTTLRDAGHSVTWCPDSARALEELSDRAFDLVVSDMHVPDQGNGDPSNGVDLIGTIRTSRFNPRLSRHYAIPIIAISGIRSRSGKYFSLELAEALGAQKIFEKPVDRTALLDSIDELCAQ